jgi:hypothetical protein
MHLEQQVVSLTLAQRLKALGVKQESLWYWVKAWGRGSTTWSLHVYDAHDKTHEYVSAFTVAELGHLLPPGTISYFDQYNDWQCKTPKHEKHIKREWSEADARAKMLISLVEHKRIPATKRIDPRSSETPCFDAEHESQKERQKGITR